MHGSNEERANCCSAVLTLVRVAPYPSGRRAAACLTIPDSTSVRRCSVGRLRTTESTVARACSLALQGYGRVIPAMPPSAGQLCGVSSDELTSPQCRFAIWATWHGCKVRPRRIFTAIDMSRWPLDLACACSRAQSFLVEPFDTYRQSDICGLVITITGHRIHESACGAQDAPCQHDREATTNCEDIMARKNESTGKGHQKVKQGTPGGAGGKGQSGTDAGKTQSAKKEKGGYGSTGSKSSGGTGSSQGSGGGSGGTHG